MRKKIDAANSEIWLVDQDSEVLEGLQLLLTAKGATTRTFYNPNALLTALQERGTPPDLIISDYSYGYGRGIMDGMASAEVSNVPVIIYSTQPKDGLKDFDFSDDTRCAYVEKSHTTEPLVEQINAMLMAKSTSVGKHIHTPPDDNPTQGLPVRSL